MDTKIHPFLIFSWYEKIGDSFIVLSEVVFFFKGFNKFDDTSFVRHSKIPFNVKDNTFEVDKERRKKKENLGNLQSA